MIHLDVTLLVEQLRRSGIQRVERELIRHWPGPAPLGLCRYQGGAMWALPLAAKDLLCGDAANGMQAEREALAPLLAEDAAPLGPDAHLVCAELFDDPARAEFYRTYPGRASWLIYDLLPWLRPEHFPAGPANRLMPFLHALRAVPDRAYISVATKRDVADRLLRQSCGGPVLPLGTDGLGLERQRFDPVRRDIVVLGTIEPRKRVGAAIRAAEALWRDGAAFRLVLIGVVEPDALAEQAQMRALTGEARLVQAGALPDAQVRAALRQARALLFPSEGEGYGLPPMEALYCGLPVLVRDDLPALQGVAAAGQIRLRDSAPATLAAAIRAVLDDERASALFDAAAALRLPTWRDFAGAVAGWLLSPAPRGRARG